MDVELGLINNWNKEMFAYRLHNPHTVNTTANFLAYNINMYIRSKTNEFIKIQLYFETLEHSANGKDLIDINNKYHKRK